MVTTAQLLEQARAIAPELVALRRELHKIPEFAFDLPQTQKRLLEEVSELGEIHLGRALSSIVLHIRGAKPGPTVLLRADMDALAVTEQTEEPFASTNGFMHACGHDLHMAGAVGAARILYANREALAGDVIIWFQPGEEGHHGADEMILEGALDITGQRPVAAYGIHVFTSLPLGAVACKPGALMASSGDLKVTVRGAGGHGSMPWLSLDPISPLVEIMSALPTMVAKRFSAFDPVIVNVGWVRAGDTATTNVIPDSASFGATVRTFSEAHAAQLQRHTRELVTSIAAAYGVTAEVDFSRATRVLINDADAVEVVKRVTGEMLGPTAYQPMATPIAGGEDFASVVHEVPGAFVFVGACPPDQDHATAPTNHSALARFDDSVLAQTAAMLAGFAMHHLADPR
jgi:hippurate hydrolase